MALTENDLMEMGFFPNEFTNNFLKELNENIHIKSIEDAKKYISNVKFESKDWWDSFLDYLFPIKEGYYPVKKLLIKDGDFLWRRKDNILIGANYVTIKNINYNLVLNCCILIDDPCYISTPVKKYTTYGANCCNSHGICIIKNFYNFPENWYEDIVVFQALSNKDLLPLCMGIKWAEPILEYIYKN